MSEAYARAAAYAALFGTPFKSLADAVREQAEREAAAKIVSFADMRRRLRPTNATDPAA
jgi:hypothetical protein